MRQKVIVLTDRLDAHHLMTNGVKVGKAFHKLGYNVLVMEHNGLDVNKIKQADVILASGTLIYRNNTRGAAIVAKNKKSHTPFILWYFDACCPQWKAGRRKYDGIMSVVGYLDWLVTTDHSHPWENVSKNYLHLMQGVDEDEFNGVVAPYDKRPDDVIFTGSHSGVHDERRIYLRLLQHKFSMAMHGWDAAIPVYGNDFWRAHQKAKMVFVPLPPKVIPGPYWSNRVYTAAATGTPCLIGYTKGIEQHYENGKEALFFHDRDDLIKMADKLYIDAGLRERIGTAARIRTLKEHTYVARVQTLMKHVFPN